MPTIEIGKSLFKADIVFDPEKLSKTDISTKRATEPPTGTLIKTIYPETQTTEVGFELLKEPIKTDIDTKSGHYNAPMEIINKDLGKEEGGEPADPAVIAATSHNDQVLFLKSAPRPSAPPQKPREPKQESWFDRFWKILTEEGRPGRGNLSGRVGRQETGYDKNGSPTYWD